MYASLLFLLLVFSILILLFSAFFGYNYAVEEQMRIEHERSLEKIIISGLKLDENFTKITHVSISNTGTITVRIRAIYVANLTTTTLVCDPSTYWETLIEPAESLQIPIPDGSGSGIPFEPTNAKIMAATERGVKTGVPEGLFVFGPTNPPEYEPSRFYIGPLMLQFNAFWYRKTTEDGVLDPNYPWTPGWSMPHHFGYCAWKVSVMNVDDRNITINRYSSFNAVPVDSPSNELSWYLEPTDQTNYTQFIASNQTVDIVYIWSDPKMFPEEGENRATKMTLPECRCMVFLTFFGWFHEHDGTMTPYAQTIPFEAAISVE